MRKILLSLFFASSLALPMYAASDSEVAKALSAMIHKNFGCRSGGAVNPSIWCYAGTAGMSFAGGKDIVLVHRASGVDPLVVIRALDSLGRKGLADVLSLYEKSEFLTIEELMMVSRDPVARKLFENYKKLLKK